MGEKLALANALQNTADLVLEDGGGEGYLAQLSTLLRNASESMLKTHGALQDGVEKGPAHGEVAKLLQETGVGVQSGEQRRDDGAREAVAGGRVRHSQRG